LITWSLLDGDPNPDSGLSWISMVGTAAAWSNLSCSLVR